MYFLAANAPAPQPALTVSAATLPASPLVLVTPAQAAATVEDTVENYFSDIPLLVSVARCESHFRQFEKDGSVKRGEVNHYDVGVMQVNELYHADMAKKLGIDLYTLEGNLEYARYLYEREGAAPWSSSAKCWGADAKKVAAN